MPEQIGFHPYQAIRLKQWLFVLKFDKIYVLCNQIKSVSEESALSRPIVLHLSSYFPKDEKERHDKVDKDSCVLVTAQSSMKKK